MKQRPSNLVPPIHKELEFRYNHRTDDLFDLIANHLCDLVPKQD
jgi:hypothetical protein